MTMTACEPDQFLRRGSGVASASPRASPRTTSPNARSQRITSPGARSARSSHLAVQAVQALQDEEQEDSEEEEDYEGVDWLTTPVYQGKRARNKERLRELLAEGSWDDEETLSRSVEVELTPIKFTLRIHAALGATRLERWRYRVRVGGGGAASPLATSPIRRRQLAVPPGGWGETRLERWRQRVEHKIEGNCLGPLSPVRQRRNRNVSMAATGEVFFSQVEYKSEDEVKSSSWRESGSLLSLKSFLPSAPFTPSLPSLGLSSGAGGSSFQGKLPSLPGSSFQEKIGLSSGSSGSSLQGKGSSFQGKGSSFQGKDSSFQGKGSSFQGKELGREPKQKKMEPVPEQTLKGKSSSLSRCFPCLGFGKRRAVSYDV